MFAKFPLFQSHIDLAHLLWAKIIKPGDTIIDATCGNGYDTYVLAKLGLIEEAGLLYAMDKQATAIIACQQKLAKEFSKILYDRIQFIQGCHSIFPLAIQPESITLIVYNLGYLPGSNKQITTTIETTLQSVEKALELIKKGGLISITCYSGHPEGKIEEDKLLEFTAKLNPSQWSCCHQRWINRRTSPSLLILQKQLPANEDSKQLDSNGLGDQLHQ